jgi:hypothetical protein
MRTCRGEVDQGYVRMSYIGGLSGKYKGEIYGPICNIREYVIRL